MGPVDLVIPAFHPCHQCNPWLFLSWLRLCCSESDCGSIAGVNTDDIIWFSEKVEIQTQAEQEKTGDRNSKREAWNLKDFEQKITKGTKEKPGNLVSR